MSQDQTEPQRQPSASAPLVPLLLVQNDDGIQLGAQRFPLAGKTFSVGRSVGNDLVIEHKSVSRQHALFECREGRWWVRSLSPQSNPVYLREMAVNDEAPLASADLLTIGNVIFQFIEPQSQSIEESLPFPIALALRQVEAAASSERRLRAALLGLELIWRFLLAAQMGTLLPRDNGELLRRLLGDLRRSTRPISMGFCMELVCSRFAPAFQGDGSPLGLTLRNLVQPSVDGGGLQQRWQKMVEMRNDLTHRWFGEEDAFEEEARRADEELRHVIGALLPLRATSMISWLTTDGAPGGALRGRPVRMLRGSSNQFALREIELLESLEPSWCYLVDDRRTPILLAPFFALATSPQTRRLDLFVSRSFGILAPGQPLEMDGLLSSHELKLPFPQSPALQQLAR